MVFPPQIFPKVIGIDWKWSEFIEYRRCTLHSTPISAFRFCSPIGFNVTLAIIFL